MGKKFTDTTSGKLLEFDILSLGLADLARENDIKKFNKLVFFTKLDFDISRYIFLILYFRDIIKILFLLLAKNLNILFFDIKSFFIFLYILFLEDSIFSLKFSLVIYI
jgi:hypothetical protein